MGCVVGSGSRARYAFGGRRWQSMRMPPPPPHLEALGSSGVLPNRAIWLPFKRASTPPNKQRSAHN